MPPVPPRFLRLCNVIIMKGIGIINIPPQDPFLLVPLVLLTWLCTEFLLPESGAYILHHPESLTCGEREHWVELCSINQNKPLIISVIAMADLCSFRTAA